MAKPNVAIIGGGIVGLALAMNLNRKGIPARVYEAAPEILELGVGITLLPHAVRELTALGLQDKLRAVSVENETSAFFNRFGQEIFSEPRGLKAGYTYPEFGIHRGTLHAILYRAAQAEIGAENILTDHKCTGVTTSDTSATASFEHSSTGAPAGTIEADLIIACDGVNSAVRHQFYPDETVAYAGINTWRGVTRHTPILGGRTYMRVGSIRTGKMVIYPITKPDKNGHQLINWVAEIQSDTMAMNDWNKSARPEDLPDTFNGWVFDWLNVRDLIGNAETIFEYPMVDKDPVERWTFGRVTLAGDAAHPMYPRGSNGSAQGLIDARTLADALAETSDIDTALAAYEAARRPATAKIVATNRTSPPDLINIHVEDLTGDKPFDDLSNYVSREELAALSDRYKKIAGFAKADLT
ncbi:MAG: flavin-dependent oxidoreductase [Henriciella sp.]|nr:flavin-dependent oxidoreductase [Henriciella sp.]